MKYTKYLLIALAAANCCQLSGMEWILYPFEMREGREVRTSLKNLQKWENAMCEALKKEDAAAIKKLKEDLQPLREHARTLNDSYYAREKFRSNKKSLVNAYNLASFHAATLAINQGCNVSVTLNFLYGSKRNSVNDSLEELAYHDWLIAIKNRDPHGSSLFTNSSPEAVELYDLLSAITNGDSCVTLKLVKIIVELNLKQLDDATVDPDRKGRFIALAYKYRFCCESIINIAEKNYGANHEITEYLRWLQRKLAWDSGH